MDFDIDRISLAEMIHDADNGIRNPDLVKMLCKIYENANRETCAAIETRLDPNQQNILLHTMGPEIARLTRNPAPDPIRRTTDGKRLRE